MAAGILFSILFAFIWPGAMLSDDVISSYGFGIWTTISRGWAFVAAAFIITVPLVQEVCHICSYGVVRGAAPGPPLKSTICTYIHMYLLK
jgi:hypothetical protein